MANYYLGIIHDLKKCLKSGIESSPAGRRMIKNPVIDQALTGGQMLFRLYECPRLIIIDSYTKEVIERAGLQGVSIIRTKDYVSL